MIDYIVLHDSRTLLVISAFATILGAYKVLRSIYDYSTSTLNNIPRPPCPSYIYGNMTEVMSAEAAEMQQKWVHQYGPTFTYKGFLGRTQLFTIDTKAVQHITNNSETYQKPEPVKHRLSMMLGEGLVIVEGDKHKNQRRIMNPAFSAAQVRDMTEIFVQKALQLRDVWLGETDKGKGSAKIDALAWLTRATLDIIGLAGFNYNFDALEKDPQENDLNKAFSNMLHSGKRGGFFSLFRMYLPFLKWLPAPVDAAVAEARKTMDRIGRQLLTSAKASLLLEGKAACPQKDLLSLLVRANESPDLTPSERMTDAEVVAQITTFMAAGHDTSSIAVTWALFALTQKPEVQAKLREELNGLSTDRPTMDELNALSYLDCVVREALRLYSPVISTIREAKADDVLPLENPIRDSAGNVVADALPVRKGQIIFVGLIPMNKSEDIWGSDAGEFKPERWLNVPEAAMKVPGVWGNQSTFLGGPRACIGYKFALVEMKALIFTLVRAFEFKLAVPVSDIGSRGVDLGSQRPILRSNAKGYSQLPLIISPCEAQ